MPFLKGCSLCYYVRKYYNMLKIKIIIKNIPS